MSLLGRHNFSLPRIHSGKNSLPKNPLNHFAHPELLYSLRVLLLLAVLYLRSRKLADQKLKQLITQKLAHDLIPSFSRNRQIFKFCLFFLELLLFFWLGQVLSGAQPNEQLPLKE